MGDSVSTSRFGVALFVLSLLLGPQVTLLSPDPPSVTGQTDDGPETHSNGFQAGWTDVTSAVHPPAVAGSMMTYDPHEGVFVLFGGSVGHPIGETWIFDPETLEWTDVDPVVSPPPRADSMLVYDTRARAVVLFGGWYETPEDYYERWADIWAFYVANRTWIERHPISSPPPRSDAAVAYDETDGVILLFGGFDGATYLGDMWYYSFDNDTWASRTAPRMPSPRADGRMVYDPQGEAFYLFSGNDYSDPSFRFHHLADMWRYRWAENEWAQIFPDALPMPRTYAVFENDLAFGELLMTGGYGNRTVLGDMWAFNTTRLVWRNITTPGGPPPRIAAVGGYDSVRDVLVLFGGGDDTSVKADTWVFRYPPPLVGSIFVSSPDPVAGQPVRFISEIQGGSGSLQEVVWDFGDGQTAHGLSTVHIFSTGGIYQVRLIAHDERGAGVERTIAVSVGFLFQFWLDIVLIVLAVPAILIPAVVLFQRYRRQHA